jgi:hypothetical protein
MPLYVLVHNTTGKYVSMAGSEHSYTTKLEKARIFRSTQTARFHACVESETIVNVDALLQGKG